MGKSNFDSIDAKTGFTVAGESVPSGTQVANIAELTDSSGGTPAASIVAVSGSGADAAINNNFASINAKLDKIILALEEFNISA